MNFLAHYALIREPNPDPMLVLGNALPDLLPLASARSRFRAQTLSVAPECPLRDGVMLHLAADQAFHQSSLFAEAQAQMKTLLCEAGFTGIRLRLFFLAHVFAELTLDAVLLRANPDQAERFYAAFASADFAEATCWSEQALHTPLPALPAVLTRFLSSRYLFDYADNAGVAEGLSRLCARARQDTFEGENFARLTQTVADAFDWMMPLTPALLAQTQRAMGHGQGERF